MNEVHDPPILKALKEHCDYQSDCFLCCSGNFQHPMPHRLFAPTAYNREVKKDIYVREIYELVHARPQDWEGKELWLD